VLVVVLISGWVLLWCGAAAAAAGVNVCCAVVGDKLAQLVVLEWLLAVSAGDFVGVLWFQ
jgi:hypothetical protein